MIFIFSQLDECFKYTNNSNNDKTIYCVERCPKYFESVNRFV